MPPVPTVSIPLQPNPAGQLPPIGSHPLSAVPLSSMHPLGILPHETGFAPPNPLMGATPGLAGSQLAPTLQPLHPSSMMDGTDVSRLHAGRTLRAPSPHLPLSGLQAGDVQGASSFAATSGFHTSAARPASPLRPSSSGDFLHSLQPSSNQQQQQPQWMQGMHPSHEVAAAPPTHSPHPDVHPHPQQLQQQRQQASPVAFAHGDRQPDPARLSQMDAPPPDMPPIERPAGHQPRFPSPYPTSQPDDSFPGQQGAGGASEATQDRPRHATRHLPDVPATLGQDMPDRWMEMWARQLPNIGNMSAAGLAAGQSDHPPHSTGQPLDRYKVCRL